MPPDRPLTGHFEAGRGAIADAAHIPEPARMMTLQPLAPHSPDAASSARFCVGWFELQPRLPVCLSHAIAPYSAARAGNAVSNVAPKAGSMTANKVERRIKLFSFR
jgi:hypothetical protein